jgi:hypothetical protein
MEPPCSMQRAQDTTPKETQSRFVDMYQGRDATIDAQ